ncbi:MFS transporter [Kribbella sandramycini]|uniref:MFS family permease n=1 Tax=Kribbella sandramycini TaxID=60450 RepID=A0A7Y4KX26_9ACTN|nr:MFS transporter [Kribbella sandramycini]MBB6569996.1 MFS family permease [Kribbella sandramycini]NOL40180.1 MFS transporter [Kribbella sandramycini]
MSLSTAPAATYRQIFANAEFRSLWVGNALGNAAATMTSLTLALIVDAATGSALLTALVMFGPSLAQVLGVSTLMSAADTARPRPLLIALATLSTVAVGIQAAVELSAGARLVLALVVAYGLSIGAGVRWGLLNDVVHPDQFVLGRSAMNLSAGAMQIAGFGLAGLLLQAMSPSTVLWLATGCSALAIPVIRFGLRNRAPRRIARTGLTETWRGNRRLLAQTETRPLLLALTIPTGLVVGCEALFVPYAGADAGWLLAATAAGMLGGDLVVGRFLNRSQRRTTSQWLRLVLALPFTAFAFDLPLAVLATLVAVGGAGYAASLAHQEALVDRTPREERGQVLGVESALRMTTFGISALLAGALADLTTPPVAIATFAIASLLSSLLLTRPLRRIMCPVSG